MCVSSTLVAPPRTFAQQFPKPTILCTTLPPMETFLPLLAQDATGGLWMAGALVGKVGGVFCSTANQHGGQESVILTFMTYLFHQGARCWLLPRLSACVFASSVACVGPQDWGLHFFYTFVVRRGVFVLKVRVEVSGFSKNTIKHRDPPGKMHLQRATFVLAAIGRALASMRRHGGWMAENTQSPVFGVADAQEARGEEGVGRRTRNRS